MVYLSDYWIIYFYADILRFMNGKKLVTQKVVENGVETLTTYENDVLKSQTVNGVPQVIQVTFVHL